MKQKKTFAKNQEDSKNTNDTLFKGYIYLSGFGYC